MFHHTHSQTPSTLNAEGFESLDANMSAKSRISVSTEEELGNSMERKDADDDFGEPDPQFMAWEDSIFTLLKMVLIMS
ncbi:uncharacterized protein [Coffea arabica]|uniref:Uncharacterized protein isoform X2 n=1 Tax=Coffea arabica TaxID=13443 RepID=A0ABM4W9X6_COFAR